MLARSLPPARRSAAGRASSSSPLCTWAPSPGGLGAIEAALIAGLTGVGMQAGPAVSAVLLYRLATYWLPVAPGWLAWRALLRRDYV